ncbi:hypothetical protein BH11ACT6_BH11ACT6_42940 [soil metagenome]
MDTGSTPERRGTAGIEVAAPGLDGHPESQAVSRGLRADTPETDKSESASTALLWWLRDRPKPAKAVTLGGVSVGLLVAGAMLARNPWRSVDGYAGFSVSVQLWALISVGLLTASVVMFTRADQSPNEEPRAP